MNPEAPLPLGLVTALDPVSASLAGALPYHDAPPDLPDDQPLPTVRVRRRVTAPGCTLELSHHLGDQLLTTEEVELTRVPLDPGVGPRRRIYPAWTSVLSLTPGDGDRVEVVAAPEAADLPAGSEQARVPAAGPGPEDLARLVVAARRHRLVELPHDLPGDPVLLAVLVLRLTAGTVPVVVTTAGSAAVSGPGGSAAVSGPAGSAAVSGPAGSPASGARVDGPAGPSALDHLELLHPQLRGLLTGDVLTLRGDDLALARASADQRRAAWEHHHLRLRWTAVGQGAGTEGWAPRFLPPRRPQVSVVLVTRRPRLLPTALEMIAAQRAVEVEVLVALHGGGDTAAAEAALRHHGLPGAVLAVPGAVPFGAALQAAVERTTAELVTKWDDDDLYGPAHLLDLVLAHRQTGAALTGRAPEFVYLQGSDTTVWRTPGRAEADSMGLAGGTFLTPRSALEDVGGFPPVARAVDHHLKVAFKAAGERVFRTHGFGFALRRHGAGHTWEADDQRFLDQAVRTFPGLPEVLDLGVAAGHGQLDALRG